MAKHKHVWRFVEWVENHWKRYRCKCGARIMLDGCNDVDARERRG